MARWDVSADVDAEIAAERAADLRVGERPLQILVIDDRETEVRGAWDTFMRAHDRLHIHDVNELTQWLNGAQFAGLPLAGDAYVALALVDLDLGAGQSNGLEALRQLRAHPLTKNVPAVLNANGVGDYRDLLAVFAAHVNGGIHLALKSDAHYQAIREMLPHLHEPLGPDGRLGSYRPELRWIEPLRLVSYGAEHPLVTWLFGREWKRRYWLHIVESGSHREAAAFAKRKDYRPNDPAAQNRARHVARDLDRLPIAWRVLGESFLNMGSVVNLDDLAASHPMWETTSREKGSWRDRFIGRYKSVLTDADVLGYADEALEAGG